MPRTSAFFAGCSRWRLTRYFAPLIEANPHSKNQLASLVGVPASRITLWASGERLLTAEKAFELGEAVRTNLGWATSGLEFLWAAGYWPQILEVLKEVASDVDAGGPALAAELYAWLPNRMWPFELANIESRLAQNFGIARPALFSFIAGGFHMADFLGEATFKAGVIAALHSDPGAHEVLRFADAASHVTSRMGNAVIRTMLEGLDERCQSAQAYDLIARAWERYQNPRSRVSRPPTPGAGARGETRERSAARSDIHAYVIDALIEAAASLGNELFPSYAIPPIWRMLAGWLYAIDRPGTATWSVLLPDNFVNMPEVMRRDDERAALDADADMRHDRDQREQMALQDILEVLEAARDVACAEGAVLKVEALGDEHCALTIFSHEHGTPVASTILEQPVSLVIDGLPATDFQLYIQPGGEWSTSAMGPLVPTSTYVLQVGTFQIRLDRNALTEELNLPKL